MEKADNKVGFKCLNCNQLIHAEDNFCPHCSQKVRDSKISIKKLLLDFLEGFFNLDSRFFHTFFKVWNPGYLTLEYIRGKRKSYLNPVRLFIFTMVIYFGGLALFLNLSNLDTLRQSQLDKLSKSELLGQFDSLSQVFIPIDFKNRHLLDSMRAHLFSDIPAAHLDSINLHSNINFLTLHFPSRKVLRRDMFRMSTEEILDKYPAKGLLERITFRQFIKTYKNPKETIRFVFSNLVWVVILTIAFIALFMKLIYIRRAYYYVEHFIFLLNFHSISFLVFCLLILLKILNFNETVASIVIILSFIFLLRYIFIAMRKYYQQGIFKTLAKMIIIGMAYFSFMLLLFGLVALISVLLY